ncbi:hypothetical protein [[Mycobacterium] wendilense]|uniref:Uncharacterized protein n=1 Tax=[Mycobacterium] wendilense TaxID=3064284 RepID=A0ABM9M8M2_9MYCO|nr:hypothetical protein [Mycolicibacterium sp. MU0050]CAJ1579117.1 hypothetical protein MU0050_000347 [Mycolicibacterium sp. MU0050]
MSVPSWNGYARRTLNCGVKVTSLASTVLSKPRGRCSGPCWPWESDPVLFAELAKGRIRSKIPRPVDALRGRFRIDHHGVLVKDLEPIIDRVQAIPGLGPQMRDRVDHRGPALISRCSCE